ncbi:MAG TPA: hypothetical protein VFS30_01330, partial [Dehalococcoidia bacterium]|nr:hypothetical protein [Dehalococcoidia bacterium]
WYFTTQMIMLEGESGETSLDSSAGLVAGRGWPTAGLLIGSGIITVLPLLIAGFVLQATTNEATSGIIGAALGIIVFPYTVATTLMIYYDLKLRKQPSTIPRYSSEDPPHTN